VDGKTGVGVRDSAYLNGIASDSQLYQEAVENGWDMRHLDVKEMIGLMYSNKTSYLIQNGGLKNLDALWKSACIGLALNPNDWMLAQNWRNIRTLRQHKADDEKLEGIQERLSELTGAAQKDFMGIPGAIDPNYVDFNNKDQLKKKISTMEQSYGPDISLFNPAVKKMKDRLKELENPYSWQAQQRKTRIASLKSDEKYLRDKIELRNRKSNALKDIERLGRLKYSKKRAGK
jgi:hypothetical protein